ncbi:MAG: hypothetical protein Q8L14_03060 [Myxococcales bacterium]|nr:hypothetical protein [Myxococcales bacterium]
MRWLLLASLSLSSAVFAEAPKPCSCGQPNCEAACTCSAGTCPLHRPKPPPAPPAPPAPKR